MFESVNWTPDEKELRRFSTVTGLSSIAISAFLWWRGSPSHGWDLSLAWTGRFPQIMACFVMAFGLTVFVLGRTRRRALRPVFIGSQLVGSVVSFIISRVVLLLVYYLVVTPIGLVLRLAGKDPVDRRWDSEKETHWKEIQARDDKTTYKRQF
jgi:hypothetical protein